jgi:FtsP/CotA-like multicopper oxidase with cupredoxin domain
MTRAAQFVLVPTIIVLATAMTRSHSAEPIAPNDNRQPAGTLANGVLTVNVEARVGVWHPEGDQGIGLEVAAFSEAGKPMSAPGPMIRVPAGTVVRGTVRNLLDKPLVLFGLGKTRGPADSIMVPMNGSAAFEFSADKPGTYFYLGLRSYDFLGDRADGDQQLNGAIIVDPPGAPRAAHDRVMLISWNGAVDSASKTGLGPFTMVINGLSWPHTERLDYTQGDSVHWRVINLTESDHPMHLHGFYFRLESRGNGAIDTIYAAAQQRMAVTEVIAPFHTMTLSWKADRAGNWIFHCHYAMHLSNYVALDSKGGAMDMPMTNAHPSDAPHQMFGLVMGIRVAPRGAVAVVPAHPRVIRVLVREKANVYGAQPAFSFVVDGTIGARDPTAMSIPGEPLILERGKPVAITIVNTTSDHATIHWHGIELESYPDGVPGWSGSGANIMPAIAPHDSLTVRFTPPRAGTFMYHSHFSEVKQIGGGAYGPIIVLEPGQQYDPKTDKILFFGTAGSGVNPVFGPYPAFLMNGKAQPYPIDLKAGTRYRFRLLNLAGDGPLLVGLKSDTTPVMWKAVAKDGFTLPAGQATMRPAMLIFDPGEIYDFEYTPAAPGLLAFTFGLPPFPPGPPPPGPFTPPPPTITVPVRVN